MTSFTIRSVSREVRRNVVVRTGGPAALNEQSRYQGVCNDREVPGPAREVGIGDTAALSITLGYLIETDSVLLGTVEVVVLQRTAPSGCRDEKTPVFGLVAQILNG